MHKGNFHLNLDFTEKILILVNFIPLFGVILFDLPIGSILLIYWAESLVIGIYTVLKIFKIPQKKISHKIIVAILFSLHFTLFLVAHFFLILTFISIVSSKKLFVDLIGIFIPLIATIIPLTISHGISYKENYIGKEEYQFKSIKDITTNAYERTLLMNIVIIIGGFISIAFGKTWIVIIFILLKMPFDLNAHKKEHVYYTK